MSFSFIKESTSEFSSRIEEIILEANTECRKIETKVSDYEFIKQFNKDNILP